MFGFFSVQVGSGTVLEFVHSRLSRTGSSLVRAHNDALASEFLDQWPDGHQSNGRGTIGVGNQFGFFGFLSVDFGHDQWDILVVTKGGLYHR